MLSFPKVSALALMAGLALPPALAAQDDGAPPAGASVEVGQEQGTTPSPDDMRKEALQTRLKEVLKKHADMATVKVDAPEELKPGWQAKVDRAMKSVNGQIGAVFFYPIGESELTTEDLDPRLAQDPVALQEAIDAFVAKAAAEGFDLRHASVELLIPTIANSGGAKAKLTATKGGIPLAVLWLVLGAIFFTVRMGFVQLKMLGHAVAVTRGRYDSPGDAGEVSHFQALAAALSATVGLGNIAGVAIAISVGGPGATLWMIAAGFLGMASKFTECSLGQMYRQQRPDGSVMGGAMYYLSNGLKELGLGGLGKFLAVFFAILCVGGSLAGGNSFQVNQSLNAVEETMPFFADYRWVYGLIMTAMVAAVILGGLRRIAQTAEKIVPTMCGIYVLAALFVILVNADQVGSAFSVIWSGAFTPAAGFGGLMGVLIQGFKRAAFSNEAGVGSAAIAHSAAKTEYPVREGVVALLEPMIDTIIVCTMTALVIVITGAYSADTLVDGQPVFAPYLDNANGAGLTSQAFGSAISWFPHVLSIAVVLFAFSTMISWSYYGERCWVWMFGDGSSLAYKCLFLVFVFLGAVITAEQVLEFGDLMILGMAFPNVLGVIFLSGKVKRALDSYRAKLSAGEFQTFE
jgi:AGCS family alanine or glycine:cation symporter